MHSASSARRPRGSSEVALPVSANTPQLLPDIAHSTAAVPMADGSRVPTGRDRVVVEIPLPARPEHRSDYLAPAARHFDPLDQPDDADDEKQRDEDHRRIQPGSRRDRQVLRRSRRCRCGRPCHDVERGALFVRSANRSTSACSASSASEVMKISANTRPACAWNIRASPARDRRDRHASQLGQGCR